MKILFFLIGLLFPVASFAATTGQQAEQTQSFISALLNFFSINTLINIGLAILAIICTIILSKFIQNRLFTYLERSNIGDDDSKEELVGVISRTINIIVFIAGFSIAL